MFIGFRFEVGRNLESNHVFFQDFMANHYSDLHAQLNLSNVFSEIRLTTDAYKKDKVINKLSQAILDNHYDKSYLRVANFVKSNPCVISLQNHFLELTEIIVVSLP
jgi:hypothetical protein